MLIDIKCMQEEFNGDLFLPVKCRDDSAWLELSFAERLRIRRPDFEVAKVDLAPFRPLKAKIDCLTISRRGGIPTSEVETLKGNLQGTVARPNDRPKTVTIHDPTLDDLRYLLRHYSDARVMYMEIAVDARLPNGSNDMYLLRQLKEQIRHCIAPRQHARFKRIQRLYWDLSAKRHSPDPMHRLAPLTTVTFDASRNGAWLKSYIKTVDQHACAPEYLLRVELSMESVCLEHAGVDVVADLPAFGETLRKFCAKAFFIGQGFKHGDDDAKKWRTYGASWDLNGAKKLGLIPDSAVNRAIGDALGELGRTLRRITRTGAAAGSGAD